MVAPEVAMRVGWSVRLGWLLLAGCAPEDGTDVGGAIDALPERTDDAYAPDHLSEGGMVLDRVEAVVSPAVGEADLEAALARQQATIVQSSPSSPYVLLAVEPAPTEQAARDRAAQLASEDAFLFAFTPWEVTPAGRHSLAPAGLAELPDALVLAGFPAAWNAGALAADRDSVPVVVADVFLGKESVSQLPSLSTSLLPPCGGLVPLEEDPSFQVESGNHGFWVSGIVGAQHDAAPPTGASSRKPALIAVQVGCAGGAGPSILRNVLGFPGSGSFVVNHSLGYNDPTFARVPRVQRAVHALQWRRALAPFEDRALVVVSAGNNGASASATDSWYANLAARVADLRTVVDDADEASFEALWAFETGRDPALAGTVGETLVVGGSDASGEPWELSTGGGDVRMLSVNVSGSCVTGRGDVLCDDSNGVRTDNGTSGATPQVSGLASYLWTLEPGLTPARLRSVIEDAFEGGFVQAYTAVRALENTSLETPVRAALLDVDDDGVIDSEDVDTLFSVWDAEAETPSEEARATHDRFDLNGDGFSSATRTAPFDRDADGRIEGADEEAVTDLEVACDWLFDEAVEVDEAALELASSRCGCRPGAARQHPVVGTLRCVPAGTYVQGCLEGRDDAAGTPAFEAGPTREVTLTRSLWMMEREMTASMALELVESTVSRPISAASCDGSDFDDCPVSSDVLLAVELADALSMLDGVTACGAFSGPSCDGWRLPTEAEWEYAARGDEAFTWAGSDVATDVGWVAESADAGRRVGCELAPNGFGLCDMTGNIAELTMDFATIDTSGLEPRVLAFSTDAVTDPLDPGDRTGSFAVMRGGGATTPAGLGRICTRFATPAVNTLGSNSAAGVRLVVNADE